MSLQGLQVVTGNYKALRARYKGVKGVTRGEKRLHGARRGYSGLEQVT